MKRALITGMSGQDGSYLAELLLGKGYSVSGVMFDTASTHTLDAMRSRVECITGDICDEAFVRRIVAMHFDEIYNLASISTVQSPWEDPVGVVRSTGLAPLFFLEAIRTSSPQTRFFQASSAEMYGDPVESPQTEETPFHPRSPYGMGKLLAHQMVEQYRLAHGLFAVSGILFNHESPRRGEHFVTRKITSTLARIAQGSHEVLTLGNLEVKRDWSFAGDIVEGMWLSLQQEKPDTYVFASGEVHTVREFVDAVAKVLKIPLRWQGTGTEEKGISNDGVVRVAVNRAFFRPVESVVREGDITRAHTQLNWQPKTSFEALVKMMAEADLEALK